VLGISNHFVSSTFSLLRSLLSPLKQSYKDKGHPITGHQGPRGGREPLILNLGARWGWVVSTTPGRFTLGKDPVPIVQEAGWAPGPVWTCAKNLAPIGIRSPDRPARSQSLYRLSYPAQKTTKYLIFHPSHITVPKTVRVSWCILLTEHYSADQINENGRAGNVARVRRAEGNTRFWWGN
jgi:hypothetical protein